MDLANAVYTQNLFLFLCLLLLRMFYSFFSLSFFLPIALSR